MKKYILIILVFLFCGFSNAQKITEHTSYTEAIKEFFSEEKVMIIYFLDGKNSKLERKIEKEFLKSSVLKQLNKNVVLLRIDSSKEANLRAYNGRPLLAYNSDNVFPSIKAYVPGHEKYLPLQTSFTTEDISKFLREIKSL